MVTSDYTYATAAELTAAMDSGSVSAVELTVAAIDRITRRDHDLNAISVRDFDRAVLAARHADEARARGERRPLLGIPTTVKESFNIKGLPTTWGLPPFKNFVASEDAVAVARLKAAGAVILGKTNVPVALGDLQTYNPLYGTTNNPWNLARTPGGSSGGSAAALAAGFGAVSIGSDIAGSLRVPAHFSGVYAHKSSWGLLPVRGHTAPGELPLPYDRDLTVIGPMARSAADLTLMLDVLAAPDDTGTGIAYKLALPAARHENLAGFRVLVLETHPLIPTSSEIRLVIQRLATALGAAGATVRRQTSLLPDQVEGARIYMRLLYASIAAAYTPDLYGQGVVAADQLEPGDLTLAAERIRGVALSHRDWIMTDTIRARHRAGWNELFNEFDIVLCPAAPTTAFVHDHSLDQWKRTISIDGVEYAYPDQLVWAGVATAPGLPATVVPVATSSEGLPIGVQLVGPMLEDRTPLRFAELMEKEFGGFAPPATF
ncbi:amidase [Actinoplanes sp. TBRC 11911]|nr:amidase [Actinoplanes sp. TBRC 11911]